MCALVSALGLVLISRSRAQTLLVEEVAESEAAEGGKADDALAAELAELLSKPVPAFTRAFDSLAGVVSSNELQTLRMGDSRELEAQIEKLKSPAEKQAEKLAIFAILHPAEFGAAVSALAPVRERAPEDMDDTELALFATTNTVKLSKAVAARVRALPRLEAMRLAAQAKIEAGPPPERGARLAPMVPISAPKNIKQP